MNPKRYLPALVVSIGVALILGFGAWGFFGSGSRTTGDTYGMMGYACEPIDESVGVAPSADADWGMMDEASMME